ncbi:hypothetical protein NL676_006570 [Syzygium grande]|nr:hypothetical protein NL676_006570 [Syzygium grande]
MPTVRVDPDTAQPDPTPLREGRCPGIAPFSLWLGPVPRWATLLLASCAAADQHGMYFVPNIVKYTPWEIDEDSAEIFNFSDLKMMTRN